MLDHPSVFWKAVLRRKSIMNNTIENNAFESDDIMELNYITVTQILRFKPNFIKSVGLMAIRKSMFLMKKSKNPLSKIFNNYFEEMAFSYDSKPEKLKPVFSMMILQI